MVARKALGKGLGALFPEVSEKVEETGREVMDIPISEIEPNPYQPRTEFNAETMDELKRSILERGVIQPIIVRRTLSGYQVVVGERRLRAVKEAGLVTIPAIIIDVSSPEEMIEMALTENIQREDLNPVEEARAYKTLMDRWQFTQDEVAHKVGKDRSTVSNLLRLLRLPGVVQESLIDKQISVGHARALLALDDEEQQIELAQRIISEGLSVREVEQAVKSGIKRAPKKKIRPEMKKAAEIVSLEENLQRFFGTSVKIKKGRKAGKIEIEFYSESDLERLIDVILGR